MNKKETKTILLIDYNRKSGQFWTKAGRTNFQDFKKNEPKRENGLRVYTCRTKRLIWVGEKGKLKAAIKQLIFATA